MSMHRAEGIGMTLNGVILAVSAGAFTWSLPVAVLGHLYEAEWTWAAADVAMGSLLLCGLSLWAAQMQRSGPWFQCYLCHGSYLRHEVEPIAGRGHVCESCLIQRPTEAA